MKKIAFAGHSLVFDRDVRKRLLDAVEDEIKNGARFFTMGRYGEFDKMALDVCKELRNTYQDIIIEVVVTSFQQINPIIESDQFGTTKYYPYEDVEAIMYDIENEHYKRRITVSNRKMIDNCDTLICYVNKNYSYSGAKRTLNYAKKKGLEIINLYKNI